MPFGPRQGVATNVQRSLDGLLDTLGLAIGCIFCVFLSAPLMKELCSRGHHDPASASLGAESQAPRFLTSLRLYTSSGSAAARASFLVQYSPRILRSMLSLRGPDTWLAAIVSFWLLRVASRICLPQRTYTQLAAPFLTFAARGAPLALFLAAGPSVPLSSTASEFLFRCQGFLDAMMSLTQPAIYATAEVTFNVLSMAAVGLLAAWHGGGRVAAAAEAGGAAAAAASDAPSERVFVGKVLLQRAALVVAVHLLAWRFLRRRRPQRHSSGGGVGGGGGGGVAARTLVVAGPPGAAAAVLPLQLAQAQRPDSDQQPAMEARQPSQQQQQPPSEEQGHRPEAGGIEGRKAGLEAQQQDATCGHCSGGTCKLRRMPCQAEAAAAAAEATAAAAALAAAADCEDPATVLANLAASLPAVAAAAAAAASAGRGVRAPYGASRTSPGMPYKSPVRRRTMRIKIPFAEPDQISPGYVQRLEALAAERGMHLSGVYVRAGCIELLLDLEAEAFEGLAALSADGSSRKAAFDLWVGSEIIADLDLSADVGAILRSLGVGPGNSVPDGRSEAASAAAAPVGINSVQLGGHAVKLDDAKQANHPPGPRLLELSPRVLLRKQQARLHRVPPEHGAPAVATLAATVSYTEINAASASVDADTAAATATPTMDQQQRLEPPPEVVVRSQGVYLPCRVSRRTGDGAGARVGTVLYDVELLELPERDGTLLVEFRWRGALTRATPLLALDDEAVTAELQSAVAQMRQPAAAAGNADGVSAMIEDMLDDLLLDIGAWLTASATAADAAAIAPPGTAAAALPPPHLPMSTLETLMKHLLHHATACGWIATADRIRADLARARPAADISGVTDSGSGIVAAEPAAAAATTTAAAAAAADADAAWGMASGRTLLSAALQQAVGWSVLPPKEEEAYQTYAAPRVLAYSHFIQAVEISSLLALLFRARQQLLDPGNLTSLAGCAVGTFTAAARPFLPRRRWEWLVNAVKIPRYAAYMTAKLMIGGLGFPAPPGIVPYQLGPAMLIMEGVLLPFSCLMSPRAALVLALIKMPFGVAMTLASGATDSVVLAAVLCLRVVLLAVVTTIACHTYLRYSYALWAAAGENVHTAVVPVGGRRRERGGGGGAAAARAGLLRRRPQAVAAAAAAAGVAGTSAAGGGGGVGHAS